MYVAAWVVQMQNVVQQAETTFGPSDYMICNAGAAHPGITVTCTGVYCISDRDAMDLMPLHRQNRGSAHLSF